MRTLPELLALNAHQLPGRVFIGAKNYTEKALYWANISQTYDSMNLADKLIFEIKAHLDAAMLHREVVFLIYQPTASDSWVP